MPSEKDEKKGTDDPDIFPSWDYDLSIARSRKEHFYQDMEVIQDLIRRIKKEEGLPFEQQMLFGFSIYLMSEMCVISIISSLESYFTDVYNILKAHKKTEKVEVRFLNLCNLFNWLWCELRISPTELLEKHEIDLLEVFIQSRHIIVHRAGRNDKRFINKVKRIYERRGLEFNEPEEYRYIFTPTDLEKLIKIVIKMVDNFHDNTNWGEAGKPRPIGELPKVQYFGLDDPDLNSRFSLSG